MHETNGNGNGSVEGDIYELDLMDRLMDKAFRELQRRLRTDPCSDYLKDVDLLKIVLACRQQAYQDAYGDG